ncbi:MAG: type II methionyl aminopeptidase [Thermoplasmatota archaeon]
MPVIDGDETFQKWLRAGQVAAQALQMGRDAAVPGAKLVAVSEAVEAHIRAAGLEPAFPCTVSLDECAAHFTPTHDDQTVLQEGQLAKIDCGATLDGALSDNAITVEIGAPDGGEGGEHARLVEAAKACLAEAVSVIGPNVNLGHVGAVIEHTAKDFGFKTIQNLTGHSLEAWNLHAGLTVPNVDMKINRRPRVGDVLACEPFVTDGQSGRVENSGPGNIYHWQRAMPQRLPAARRLMGAIQKAHPKLPFAQRWLTEAIEPKKLNFNLMQLQKQLVLKHYPALSEASGGMVSQFEHTLIVTEDGCVVATDPDGPLVQAPA